MFTAVNVSRHEIEKALEEQSERSSHERRVMRILLSSEHTLEEMERAASISAVRYAHMKMYVYTLQASFTNPAVQQTHVSTCRCMRTLFKYTLLMLQCSGNVS